jgi:hypothetical protein
VHYVNICYLSGFNSLKIKSLSEILIAPFRISKVLVSNAGRIDYMN